MKFTYTEEQMQYFRNNRTEGSKKSAQRMTADQWAERALPANQIRRKLGPPKPAGGRRESPEIQGRIRKAANTERGQAV